MLPLCFLRQVALLLFFSSQAGCEMAKNFHLSDKFLDFDKQRKYANVEILSRIYDVAPISLRQ